ncbi:long-chain fatty acid transporter, partial [Acinetobacter baumannii]
MGNDVAKLFAGVPLGASNGPGFGWRDINVLKLGAQYQYSPNLILRGGISKSGQPVPANQTLFNILAPGVVELHLTLGGTWQL